MKWPGVQCQVQREIDREIGDATPSLRHRSVTPFTEATLLEIQRFACVVPWGPRWPQLPLDLPHLFISAVVMESTFFYQASPLPLFFLLNHFRFLFLLSRATLEDVRIGNFDVPKNTHVLYIIRAMTQNPDLFPNPKQFDPTRFLSPDGSTFVKNDNVATFGLGESTKFVCLFHLIALRQVWPFKVSASVRERTWPSWSCTSSLWPWCDTLALKPWEISTSKEMSVTWLNRSLFDVGSPWDDKMMLAFQVMLTLLLGVGFLSER